MNKIAVSFAMGACALLFGSAAFAAPLAVNRLATDTAIQNVRLVCDESNHCWRQRSERRVIVRESYGYAQPRERYIQRQGYGERNGVTLNAPGVSVGIGTNRY